MGGKPVKTVEDFRRALTTLLRDLGQANNHYELCKKLYAAQESGFDKAMSLSRTFWTLTYEAHWETAVFRLCRVYDWNRDVLNLRTFLELIRDNPALLPAPPNPLAPFEPAQLEADLRWVSPDSNLAVKHLITWRNNVYAHRSGKVAVSDESFGKKFPIVDADVAKLFGEGFEIMNRYYNIFFGIHFDRGGMLLDDFEVSLRLLQAEIEGRERRLQEQIAGAQPDA